MGGKFNDNVEDEVGRDGDYCEADVFFSRQNYLTLVSKIITNYTENFPQTPNRILNREFISFHLC